ncbi:hypothetical protein ACFSKM_02140 [Ancylobacter dichloromethanicus]
MKKSLACELRNPDYLALAQHDQMVEAELVGHEAAVGRDDDLLLAVLGS